MRKLQPALLALALCILPAGAFGDIAENFKAGGITVSGSGSLTYGAGRVLAPASES
jgi:hypothetical protein